MSFPQPSEKAQIDPNKVVVANADDLGNLPNCWKKHEVMVLRHCPPHQIFFVSRTTANEWREWEEKQL